MKRGVVRLAGAAFEARVYGYPTGDVGPLPELSHGPQVFESASAALDYAGAQMGC